MSNSSPARVVARRRHARFTRRGRRLTHVDLPAPVYTVCAACRGAIRSGDGRYRSGQREYHADCFDISLFGTSH
jgi:hypothetical protein